MIDFQAGEVQFIDHLAPIYLALPPALRGDFLVHHGLRARAQAWGITAVPRVEYTERPIVVASYGDQKRVRRQGRKVIARAEHGAGQSYHGDSRFGGNSSYPGGRDCHDVSLFLCPNEQSADRWQDAYPHAAVEVVGCPKLDYLPAKEPGPVTVAVSFHFDINIIPETRWAWPAYRPVLPALAQQFAVIAHAHPKGIGLLHRYYQRLGIEVAPDFADVCRRADVYVVDNSSTAFEFAATGRPVVLLNIPAYRRDVSHGLRFWDAAHVGLQCDRPEDLPVVVSAALEDRPEQQAAREDALGRVYAYRSGGAQRAAAALMAWAGSRVEVAA